jgi:hypothetical protein
MVHLFIFHFYCLANMLFSFLRIPAGALTFRPDSTARQGAYYHLHRTHTRTRARAHTYTHALFLSQLLSWYAPCLCRHPDKNQEDTKEKFQEINEAYQCLQEPLGSMEADYEDGGSSYPVFEFYTHSAVITYAAQKYGQRNSDMIEWKSSEDDYDFNDIRGRGGFCFFYSFGPGGPFAHGIPREFRAFFKRSLSFQSNRACPLFDTFQCRICICSSPKSRHVRMNVARMH